MANYESGNYDSGLFYDAVMPTTPKTKMISLKLELKSKSDAELKQFSQDHINAMTGNANVPAPVPDAPTFLASHNAFSAALGEFNTAQQVAQQKTVAKDVARASHELMLTQRARNIEGLPGMTEAKALTTGFALKAGPAPVGELPAPQNLGVTGGDLEGENDLHWNPVKGRTTYIAETSPSATGPWTQFYVGKKSSATASGLTPGALNYFRVRAVGAAGPGAWSDIAQGRAT